MMPDFLCLCGNYAEHLMSIEEQEDTVHEFVCHRCQLVHRVWLA